MNHWQIRENSSIFFSKISYFPVLFGLVFQGTVCVTTRNSFDIFYLLNPLFGWVFQNSVRLLAWEFPPFFDPNSLGKHNLVVFGPILQWDVSTKFILDIIYQRNLFVIMSKVPEQYLWLTQIFSDFGNQEN